MLVLKFGGSTVGTLAGLNNLKSIVNNKPAPCIVVVSAISGITNLLTEIFNDAIRPGSHYGNKLSIVREKHLELAEKVLDSEEYQNFTKELDQDLDRLDSLLSSVSIMRNNLKNLEDHVLSMGEQFSSKMIVRMFRDAVRIDGRELIVTRKSGDASQILWDETCNRVNSAFEGFSGLAIIPGFCGKTPDGYVTTLGRGGSDLSAAMIAAAVNAEKLYIWSDVDGMMTSDPDIYPGALSIPHLSYSEAAEMCHFGAKVLYTPAIWPAIKSNTPIHIKNTFNPDHCGTIIDSEGDRDDNRPVKGITHISGISLITVFGNGLMGQVGTSYRIFGAIADKGINIVFIAQASSEYSISFAVKDEDGQRAMDIIKSNLEADQIHGTYIDVEIERNMAIIAIVGSKMRMTPGISGRIFTALGDNKINVVATAQGGSELNVSVIVKNEDVKRGVELLHNEFFN